jgi:hypothetical protein
MHFEEGGEKNKRVADEKKDGFIWVRLRRRCSGQVQKSFSTDLPTDLDHAWIFCFVP